MQADIPKHSTERNSPIIPESSAKKPGSPMKVRDGPGGAPKRKLESDRGESRIDSDEDEDIEVEEWNEVRVEYYLTGILFYVTFQLEEL